MKGLLLKDWYMMKKYCRAYIVIAAVFIAFSLVSIGNMFSVVFLCILCVNIPVTLLSFDEKSRWMQYSGTMPYTKAQIVSEKYLIGLLVQLTILIITGIANGIKMVVAGNFVLSEVVEPMMLMLIAATLMTSISFPFIFKLGFEKGQIAYYVMMGVVVAGSVVASRLLNIVLAIIAAVGIGVYILSWYLSVVLFKKRDIQ